MPGPGTPEEEKIIIDGDLAGAIFSTTCEAIEKFLDKGNLLQESDVILRKLIKAENAAFEFQRAVLEGMGYHGPWPLCLMTVAEIKALP